MSSSPGPALPTLDRHSSEGRELLAPQSETLRLPPTSTFAPLPATLQSVRLSAIAQEYFSSHITHTLPCGIAHKGAREHATVLGTHDAVHCLTLHASICETLNKRITEIALGMEKSAMAFGANDNAQLSNWGGFQSTSNCFDGEQGPAFGELHRIVSVAVGELLLGEGSGGPPSAGLQPGFAWVNINRRATDKNLMHIHNWEKLSAVYFVSSGDCDVQSAAANLGGDLASHLILRGGPADADAPPTAHTYLAVPPTPGTLWLFAGSVPHCVFASDADEPSQARISVAVNLGAAAPPPVPARRVDDDEGGHEAEEDCEGLAARLVRSHGSSFQRSAMPVYHGARVLQ